MKQALLIVSHRILVVESASKQSWRVLFAPVTVADNQIPGRPAASCSFGQVIPPKEDQIFVRWSCTQVELWVTGQLGPRPYCPPAGYTADGLAGINM